MKNLLAVAAIASAFALSSAPTAHAQCAGKIVIDTVYQRGTNAKFEYFTQLRNNTTGTLTFNLELGQFPADVSLFSRSLPGIILKAHENKQIRFATGPNSQINDGTVNKFYDVRSSANKPYVLVTNCR